MEWERFKALAQKYSVVPVYAKITADLLTPVLAFLKMRRENNYCFLLESVEGIGRLARYSFVGRNPVKIFYNRGEEIQVIQQGKQEMFAGNLFSYLKQEITRFNRPQVEDLPDFTGGIVGYLGYENIALIEDVIRFKRNNEIGTPDAIFAVYTTIAAFDHYKHQLILINNVFTEKCPDLRMAYESAQQELHQLYLELAKPVSYRSDFCFKPQTRTQQDLTFAALIEHAKENIRAGDIFQIVLSRRFAASYQGDLFNVYRALRIINPSPYMYYMELGEQITLAGTSPEDLIRVNQRKVTILPIAGTRRRGKDEAEDRHLEHELLTDPKERAEHVMLVDLARNDLGRICTFDTIRLSEEMKIQRYSHVMHIVSRVEGELQENRDCIDALMAGFPAGTLTGAPKIRAVQLIDHYEQVTRNVYGGAVGYIDFGGNMDMCIAIRTLFARGDTVYWQAGAGIVADSQPQLEIKEIENKSAVMEQALKYAEEIDEDFNHR
jgi:anthranilate synthase component I